VTTNLSHGVVFYCPDDKSLQPTSTNWSFACKKAFKSVINLTFLDFCHHCLLFTGNIPTLPVAIKNNHDVFFIVLFQRRLPHDSPRHKTHILGIRGSTFFTPQETLPI
jgi:hypothetical protein